MNVISVAHLAVCYLHRSGSIVVQNSIFKCANDGCLDTSVTVVKGALWLLLHTTPLLFQANGTSCQTDLVSPHLYFCFLLHSYTQVGCSMNSL